MMLDDSQKVQQSLGALQKPKGGYNKDRAKDKKPRKKEAKVISKKLQKEEAVGTAEQERCWKEDEEKRAVEAALQHKLKFLNIIGTVKEDRTVEFEVPEDIKHGDLVGDKKDVYAEVVEADFQYIPPLQIVMLIVGTLHK